MRLGAGGPEAAAGRLLVVVVGSGEGVNGREIFPRHLLASLVVSTLQ